MNIPVCCGLLCAFVYGGSGVVDDAITLVWVSSWKQPPGGVFLGFTDRGVIEGILCCTKINNDNSVCVHL